MQKKSVSDEMLDYEKLNANNLQSNGYIRICFTLFLLPLFN